MAVDVLRACAALAVVVAHMPFSWRSGLEAGDPTGSTLPRWVLDVTSYGGYGVNLFLVISGFCIHMQWARRRRRDAPAGFVEFWRRRIFRLYPPYFAALALSLGGLAAMVRLSGAAVTDVASAFGYANPTQFAIDLLLLLILAQNLNGAGARVGNGPFWTLALEEQLYLLYFPLLSLRRAWGWRWTILIIFAVTMAWRSFRIFSNFVPSFWYVVGPARWLEWALGAVAVEAHLGIIVLPRWMSSPVAALAVFASAAVLVPPFSTARFPDAFLVSDVIYSFAAFILLNWLCRLERDGILGRIRLARAVSKIGLMSYSLYLIHVPAMVAAKRVAVAMGLRSTAMILGLRAGAALISAYVFFRVIEVRFLRTSRLASTSRTPETQAL